MRIGNVDLDKKVLIVAEIGNNHEGSFSLAKKLIKSASKSGADAVKFQTFRTEEYVTSSEAKRFEQLKRFELSYRQFSELAGFAKKENLIFLSTPFDLRSADFLEPLVAAYKISSGDNMFWPLIKKVALKNKPIILSTGMLDNKGVVNTLKVVQDYSSRKFIKEKVALLHCVSSYPVPDNEINLLSIKFLRDAFGLTVGYSDHSLGTLACLGAVSLGARIIEKHFTFDKTRRTFDDHQLSADPYEFSEIVRKIRLLESALGEYKKELMPCESKNVNLIRRSIAVNKFLKKGETIKKDDLSWVRPAKGLRIGKEKLVIGKRIKRDMHRGDLITKMDLC